MTILITVSLGCNRDSITNVMFNESNQQSENIDWCTNDTTKTGPTLVAPTELSYDDGNPDFWSYISWRTGPGQIFITPNTNDSFWLRNVSIKVDSNQNSATFYIRIYDNCVHHPAYDTYSMDIVADFIATMTTKDGWATFDISEANIYLQADSNFVVGFFWLHPNSFVWGFDEVNIDNSIFYDGTRWIGRTDTYFIRARITPLF